VGSLHTGVRYCGSRVGERLGAHMAAVNSSVHVEALTCGPGGPRFVHSRHHKQRNGGFYYVLDIHVSFTCESNWMRVRGCLVSRD
jgi:hypothetical protein